MSLGLQPMRQGKRGQSEREIKQSEWMKGECRVEM